MFPLVRELAADRIPVAVTCRVLKFSKQAFFKWRANPVLQRDWDNAHLMKAAINLHRDDPAFGYRFISDEIEAVSGLTASERRVWRLCSEQRLWSVFSKKRGLNRKAGPPVHDDLVLLTFTATALNQLWLVDITEHWSDEGKLYMCAIKDVASNRIVDYSIESRMTADLAVAALRHAIALRERAECTTVFHEGPDRSIIDVEFATAGWVDWYNNRRLHSSRGNVPPVEYEQAHYATLNREPYPALERQKPGGASLHTGPR